MKRYFSLLLVFTMMIILPMTAYANSGDMNSKINISSAFNYDVIIEYKSMYSGKPNAFMYNKEGISSPVNVGDLSYDIIVNDFGQDDSIYISDSDVTLSDIPALSNDENSDYLPRPKKLGIIGGTMSGNTNITVNIVYEGDSYEAKTISISPINAKSTSFVSAGASYVKKTLMGTKFNVKAGDEVYLNSYTVDVKPMKIKSITFKSNSDNPYHILAASVLYYTQEQWTENIGNTINANYSQYKNATPNDAISDYSEIEMLATLLSAIKNDYEAGNEVGLSEEVKQTLNERGIDSEIERLNMLYKSVALKNKKRTLRDEIDSLNVTDYLNAPQDSYKTYTQSDLENIEAIMEKYEEALELDNSSADILNYWNEKGVTVSVAQINQEDCEKLSSLKESYINYQNSLCFESDISSLYSLYGSKTMVQITEDDYNALKAFFENGNYFDVNLNSPFVTIDNEAKVNAMKYFYLYYEAYKNSEAPYMVEMNYNKNIFANPSDSLSSDFGMDDRIMPITSDGKQDTDNAFRANSGLVKNDVKAVLNNGILFSSEVGKFSTASAGVNVSTKLMKQDELISYGVTSTPFNLKNIDSGKNAFVAQSASDVLKITQNAFSGKSAKYLLVLTAIGNSYTKNTYNVTYTDGTVKNYEITNGWARTHEGSGAFQSTEKMYYSNGTALKTSGGTGGNSWPNAIYLVAQAIELDGKPIKAIEYSNTLTNGVQALVAMTEIPVSNSEFISDTALPSWNAVKDMTEAEYTAVNLTKIRAVVESYNEALLRGLNADEIFVYENGESGVEKIKDISTLVLTASSSTKRTTMNEIKSTIKFSVPATNIERNISVTKNAEKVNAKIIPASDGLSADIVITEGQNGGNVYSFKVSGSLPVEKNTSMTLGSDYEYSYEVPDYITYDYNNKTVYNSSDVLTDVTVASVVVDETEKIVYDADSRIIENVGNESEQPVNISVNEEADTKVLSYAFDNSFKLISNNSNIKTTTAATDSKADYNSPTFNLKTNTLTVKGFTPSKNGEKIVNLKVYDETNGKDIYFGSVRTNNDGFFQFEIALPESVYGSSFNTQLFLGGDDFSGALTVENSIYYSTTAERTALIGYLKNATDIEQITNGSMGGESVNISKIVRELAIDFEPLKTVSDNAFANSVINVLKDYELSSLTGDLELTQKVLKQAAILAAYKEAKQASIYKDGELLYEDIMNYGSIDSSQVTLYSVFKNNISNEGKEKIVSSIMGLEYENLGELYAELEKSIFVESLNYPNSLGTGYITAVLTSKNAETVGVDISRYTQISSKTAFNEKIASNRGNFTDVNSVASFISGVVITDTASNPIYTGGNTTSSISTSGISTGNNPDNDYSNSVFSDVSISHWAYKNIVSLYNKGIISGKGNNKYDPDGYVTRGEVVKMICVAYGLNKKAENPFTDTVGKWYSDYAAICYENNIVTGMADAYFGGDEKITRQDLCTILYRMKNSSVSTESYFNDKDNIADYAKDAIAYMNDNGIVNGFADNTFRPSDFCTRAQMAKIFDLFIGL